MAKIDNKNEKTPAPEKAGVPDDTTPESPPESENNNVPEPEPDPASTGAPGKVPAGPKQASRGPAKAVLPATERPYLDSPRPFGIWIDGLLVRFPKGKTKLTAEQAEALKAHPYTADNGAEVIE